MARFTLPGFYSTRDAENIKQKLSGKSFMNFQIEYGGIAGNNQISASTDNPKTTAKELEEMFYYCALTESSKI